MGQRAPTLGQIAIAVAFAFSCFGLLLFLWSTFGGPIPFKPEGYRVQVPVDEATQLAVESDVRISNVSVGKVKKIELADEGENKDLAEATLEIDDSYAPIPEDTRATLRSKTLLGETYIELTQGNRDGPKVPEGGSLPPAQVAESVQLDEIFRTFDSQTRAAFQTWMQEAAVATAGRGADLNAAIANLEPFAEDANRVLRVLDTQQGAVQQVVRSTGEVFTALSERQGQLQGLIRNAGTVFRTTASRDQSLRETFIALPTFLDESRLTLNRLESFSNNTNPLITQLHPSAKALSADLKQVAKVAPDFKGFFVGFRKLAKRAPTAFPALQQMLTIDLPPILTQLHPFTQQLTPLVQQIGRYQREITGFLGNAAAATNGTGAAAEAGGTPTHYIRSSSGLEPSALAVFGPNAATRHRLQSTRSNAYPAPGSALQFGSGPLGFETRACGPPGIDAQLDPTTPTSANFIPRATFDSPQDLFGFIQTYAFRDQTTSAGLPTPSCAKQPPQPSLGQVSESTDYPHVYRNP